MNYIIQKQGHPGGDGGKGGDIVIIGSNKITTLFNFKFQNTIKALNGQNGNIKNMHGKNAPNKIIYMPLGTLIYNNQTNQIICEIIKNEQKITIIKGGTGGRGNARFVNSKNKSPTIFEFGNLGKKIEIRCELKILADVGLLGLPNAGKSTLLSKITNAKPKIANYPFTTLIPQLGTAKYNNINYPFTIIDLPPIIKNSYKGKGLGNSFLRHIEKCKIILHIIDMSNNYYLHNNINNNNIINNYLITEKELKIYNFKSLLQKKIIVANKMDTQEFNYNLSIFKKKFKFLNIIEISALLDKNLNKLLNEIKINLIKIKKIELLKLNIQKNKNIDNQYKIYEYKKIGSDIKITNLGNNIWKIEGEKIWNIYNKTPIITHDNLLLFNKKLQKLKIFDILRKKGVKKGDIVKIFQYELEWN